MRIAMDRQLTPSLRRTMILFGLCLVSVVSGILPDIPKTLDVEVNETVERNERERQPTVKAMFKEVEGRMENTQGVVEDAVHQVEDENAPSSASAENPTSSYHDESTSESMMGNQSIHTVDRIDKVSENTTEETQLASNISLSIGKGPVDHECVGDEDCEGGWYCRYVTQSSTCLPCKQLDATCSKDEECCPGQLCVWGQCSKNATRGQAGSICRYQRDCRPDLCCSLHKVLLFPVCTAKPIERERCFISANHLMELLTWDATGEGPREHCPCADDLQCQHLGRGSLCLQRQNSSEEDLTDALYSEIDYIV